MKPCAAKQVISSPWGAPLLGLQKPVADSPIKSGTSGNSGRVNLPRNSIGADHGQIDLRVARADRDRRENQPCAAVHSGLDQLSRIATTSLSLTTVLRRSLIRRSTVVLRSRASRRRDRTSPWSTASSDDMRRRNPSMRSSTKPNERVCVQAHHRLF
jgi:hypothetical protein